MKPTKAVPGKTFVLSAMVLIPVCAFATEGQVLINQSAVIAAGGFPYKIMESGNYKLSSNLVVTSTAAGAIAIGPGHGPLSVTLDLGGFTISGPGATSSSIGIAVNTGNVSVMNGFVQGFNIGAAGSFMRLTDLVFSQNGTGVFNVIEGMVVTRCHFLSNRQTGIQGGSVVLDSVAVGNGGDGFVFADVLLNSLSFANSGHGAYGIKDIRQQQLWGEHLGGRGATWRRRRIPTQQCV